MTKTFILTPDVYQDGVVPPEPVLDTLESVSVTTGMPEGLSVDWGLFPAAVGCRIVAPGMPEFNLAEGCTYSEAMNAAHRWAVENKANAIFVLAGHRFSPGSHARMVERVEAGLVGAATLVDPVRQNIELTGVLSSVYPEMKYAMAQAGSTVPDEVVNAVDHGIFALPYHVMLEVGAFDTSLKEYWVMTDYCIRARWVGHQIHLWHDIPILGTNHPVFTRVYQGMETQLYTLDRSTLHRKWGGDVMRNIMP